MRSCLLCSIGVALLWCSTATAEDWPGWRGPRGDGSSTETGLPIRWSMTDNVAWSVSIPGSGYSSPIITGDRIFLTTCVLETKERKLLCLDRRTGATLWERVIVTAPLEGKHHDNSFASATPATDGERVYVACYEEPRMVVSCYGVDGTMIWNKSPGEFHSRHGFCSTPVLYKDMVILNGDQDAEAWIVALDKQSGAERWRTDRPNRTRSYCTPVLVKAAGKMQLVLSGSKCVSSYDPDTGKQFWIIDGPTEQFVASLVYHEGLLFLTAGFPEYHIMAIRPDGEGNVTATHIAWRDRKGAGYVPSPVACGEWFFLVNDKGIASCLEARSGKQLWAQERLGRKHYASPVVADGRIYFCDEDGITYVVNASPKFEIISRNKLGEAINASPAVACRQLFIRTEHHLYCIGTPAKTALK